jgi:hypothetical protein
MPGITIPARHSEAAQVAAGRHPRHQHPWRTGRRYLGINRHDMTEFMSMEHSSPRCAG